MSCHPLENCFPRVAASPAVRIHRMIPQTLKGLVNWVNLTGWRSVMKAVMDCSDHPRSAWKGRLASECRPVALETRRLPARRWRTQR